jgi:hypothetical protein
MCIEHIKGIESVLIVVGVTWFTPRSRSTLSLRRLCRQSSPTGRRLISAAMAVTAVPRKQEEWRPFSTTKTKSSRHG